MSAVRLRDGTLYSFVDDHPVPPAIETIAWSLSMLCRFTGHVKRFYSVAQHSVLVSRLCPPHLRLDGLLHDHTESLVGDLNSPVKSLIPEYKRFEARLQRLHAEELGVAYPVPHSVHAADMRMLHTEQLQLTEHVPTANELRTYPPIEDQIEPMMPDTAFVFFMAEYRAIMAERTHGPAYVADYR